MESSIQVVPISLNIAPAFPSHGRGVRTEPASD
jgi:hypothetical protein